MTNKYTNCLSNKKGEQKTYLLKILVFRNVIFRFYDPNYLEDWNSRMTSSEPAMANKYNPLSKQK